MISGTEIDERQGCGMDVHVAALSARILPVPLTLLVFTGPKAFSNRAEAPALP